MNDDAFVAKGYEHIWASSGHRLKWAFCGCLNDVEARAYVRTASYAPDGDDDDDDDDDDDNNNNVYYLAAIAADKYNKNTMTDKTIHQ